MTGFKAILFFLWLQHVTLKGCCIAAMIKTKSLLAALTLRHSMMFQIQLF